MLQKMFGLYAMLFALLHAGHDYEEESGSYLGFLPDFGEQILLSGGIVIVAAGVYWVTNRSPSETE